jgi:uncharacterized membrane protein
MGLTVNCQPKDTCCRRCPVFVSTTDVALSGMEVVVVDVAMVEALASRVHALVGKCFLLLVAALLVLLFLVQSVAK